MGNEIQDTDKTTVSSLAEAIKHIDLKQAEAAQKVELFRHNFQEMFGVRPEQHMTALDVAKIMLKLYGEPKA